MWYFYSGKSINVGGTIQQRVLFVRRVNSACGTGTALLAKRIPLHSKLLVLIDLSEQLSRK